MFRKQIGQFQILCTLFANLLIYTLYPDFFAGKICCLQISIQMLIFASAQHLISQLIVDGETGMLSKQNSPRRHTFFCTFYSLTLEVRGMNPLDF